MIIKTQFFFQVSRPFRYNLSQLRAFAGRVAEYLVRHSAMGKSAGAMSRAAFVLSNFAIDELSRAIKSILYGDPVKTLGDIGGKEKDLAPLSYLCSLVLQYVRSEAYKLKSL